MAAQWPAMSLNAAELVVDEGVVVKFGADAQLVVRDKLSPGKGVVLTSHRDDTIGGQIGSVAQTAAAGDWRGVRLEKSMTGYGALTLSDWQVRYAGAADEAGDAVPALSLRGFSPTLQYMSLTDSVTGLQVSDGASPAISGSSFLRNTVGLSADGSASTITQSQFVGNSSWAIDNKTPANVISATGNWWGHATGPKDSVDNPAGQGDAVSTGVDYGSFLAGAQLINPVVRLVAPASYYEQHDIQLDIACVNATEYRIAENDAFSGVPFQSLAGGRTQIAFATSSGDGRKSLSAQYRNSTGTVVSASLVGGVLIDTQAPSVTLTTPAAGSVISQPISIEANASDASGIAQVKFYIDNVLVATRTSGPYAYAWNTDVAAEGDHTIRVLATDAAGRTSEQSVAVAVSRAPQAPDTEGPVVGGASFAGAALAEGSVLTRSGQITFSASDRSGVARVDLLLDGAVVATATGSGTYSVSLDLDGVANGAHTLILRAADSLGNTADSTFNVSVAHAAPPAPVISTPANGLTTRSAAIAVSGSAQAGSQVQLSRNGETVGPALTAGGDGRFSGTIDLVAGANLIRAVAADAYGSSPLSAAVSVTLDLTVPASPSNLTAQSMAAGKVRLAWNASTDVNAKNYHVYRASSAFTVIEEALKVAAISTTAFEDLPPADGTWTYRVVAVNGSGTPSLPTNAATAVSDNQAPKALSIAYTSLGKTDAATGRIGQGRVNLILTTSEVLPSTPYLAIVPQGGAPIPVELVKTDSTTYAGNFLIDASTPSGIANALFSARDAVGNRGTDVAAGATLKIDTQGPELSGISLAPAAPIKNDTAQTVHASFTYSKAPAALPQIKYVLSGPVRSPVALTGLTAVDATTYAASFALPADAGLGTPENLSFTQQAVDDLDNVSNRVSALNRFQVYQGDLPPLDAPYGLSAKAQPGGKVKLAWQAVDQASVYEIYRQGPNQSSLEVLTRSAGVDYIDQTTTDGTYRYAIATVRQSNGQESISGQSAAVEVLASATAPGAPQNLMLTLTGQGIYAAWQAPLSSTVDYYNLYRATGSSITSIDGLTPLKTRIKTPQTYDTNPSPTEGAYVVTAVDAAGNESAMSNSAYLNASLLPVRNLTVRQIGNNLPVVTWTAPNGNVAGYLVYLGPDSAQVKLTPAPIGSTTFTDTGYTNGERRYTVASVDANGVEMPHSILLPGVVSQIASGLPVKRGVMNKLQVQIANASANTLAGVRAVVRLPVDKEGTQFKDHKSEAVTLGANETRLVPVIVGGYDGLPTAAQAEVGVEITPVDGELVKIARPQTIDVIDGALVVGMATEEFTRGGTGKLKLTIENTSDVDIELLTATGNGANASTELRFKILDADGNVLATQPYKQVFGAGVVTLTNGQTVARIAAGSNYVSDIFEVNVPAASPNVVRVRLEVDKLRYHSGQDDAVQIAGRGSERSVSLLDTAYIGEVTDVSPISSFGDQDILIAGRALDRASGTPLPNTRLKLVLNQQGFERAFNVLTDGSGNFTYNFKPTLTDGGMYKVSAVHPEITDRPEQKAFSINRVTVGPTPYKIDIPKNYAFTLPFKAKAGVGTAATNLRFRLDAASQPTGQLPAGVDLQFPAPVTLAERQTLSVPVVFTANNEALPSGALVVDVISDEHADSPIGRVRIDYLLSEAQPYLVATPSYVETGLAQGGNQIESVTVTNNGLQEALNLQFTLTKADGSAAPAWAAIASRPDGTLAVGESRAIDLAFAPPASTSEGIYELKLNVVGDNVPAQAMNVYVNLTQSGQGNILFKTADIYTATVDKNGNLIPGLAGATITVQNEDVPAVSQELITDSLGEALFQNLPAGRYKFRAKATNHQEVGGRLIIKPGITANQSVFLEYKLITVEWSVREITIQDRYEITLNATFETDVPAAVVVVQPKSINLPKMAVGEVYYGELSVTNYGLIRADDLKQKVPADDAYFRYEFLADLPPSLEAKQRVTIPYRIVALKPLEDAASDGNASGGGCYNYNANYQATCKFRCANGMVSGCGDSAGWFSNSNSSCGGGGTSSTSSSSYTGPRSVWGADSGGTRLPMKGKKCVNIAGDGPCN